MRRFVTALVILLALYLVLSRFTELEQLAAVLQRGNWFWLGAALIVQTVWLANTALTYRAIYRLLGLAGEARHLLMLSIASKFIDTLAPSGGAGGMAVFIADARQRGQSPARVTIAGVLYVQAQYLAFLCVLALGLLVLVRRNRLTPVEVGAALILLVVALGLAALLALGASNPARFERVLAGLARLVNRLLWPLVRRPYLSEARAHLFAQEAAEGLSALRTHPRHYLPPALHALAGQVLLVLVLTLTYLAFNEPFSTGTVVAGYSIGYLFMIVSPTPAGIGVVEGAMTLALISLGASLGAATIITLVYRGLTFWLPFLYGFVALRLLGRRWRRAVAEAQAEAEAEEQAAGP